MSSSTAYRVVIDTNVFVSAILWGGNPQKVIQRWLDGAIRIYLSPFLASEIEMLLTRFGVTDEDKKRFLDLLEAHALKVAPKHTIPLCRDPKDNTLLELAVWTDADYLITGDKDLLVLKKVENTTIESMYPYNSLFAAGS